MPPSVLSPRRTSESQPLMLSCFDFTTNMALPWAEAGYLWYCVDLQDEPGERRTGNIVRVGANMMDWLPPSASAGRHIQIPGP